MAPNAKPMSGTKLASIITALGNAYDYGTAAMLNSNPEERAALEAKMLNRLQAAVENAGFELRPLANVKVAGISAERQGWGSLFRAGAGINYSFPRPPHGVEP